MIAVKRSSAVLAAAIPICVGIAAGGWGFFCGKHSYGDYVSEDGSICHAKRVPDPDLTQDMKIRNTDKRLDTIEERLDKHADRLRALEARSPR